MIPQQNIAVFVVMTRKEGSKFSKLTAGVNDMVASLSSNHAYGKNWKGTADAINALASYTPTLKRGFVRLLTFIVTTAWALQAVFYSPLFLIDGCFSCNILGWPFATLRPYHSLLTKELRWKLSRFPLITYYFPAPYNQERTLFLNEYSNSEMYLIIKKPFHSLKNQTMSK